LIAEIVTGDGSLKRVSRLCVSIRSTNWNTTAMAVFLHYVLRNLAA